MPNALPVHERSSRPEGIGRYSDILLERPKRRQGVEAGVVVNIVRDQIDSLGNSKSSTTPRVEAGC